MGFFSSLDISAAGLHVQQVRLEVIAANLANAQTTLTAAGRGFRPMAVTVSSFPAALSQVDVAAGTTVTSLPSPVVAGIAEVNLPTRTVHNPGHPDADARGLVTMPGTDPVGWTLDMMSASRAYEANLRAFDITRNLMLRTIEIGGQR